MTETQKCVIALIKSALSGNAEMPSTEPDWEKIAGIAKKHQVFSLIYYGAFNSGVEIPEKYRAVLENYVFRGVLIDQKQIDAVKTFEEEFTKNQIDYMLLKGSCLKYIYPKTDMRAMGDIDILIKMNQYEKIIPIMENLGYIFHAESTHDLEWDGDAHIELHKSLIPPQNTDFYGYFGTGWDKAIKSPENPYSYMLSNEEQLIFLFTHFVKHYRSSGIGLRHMTDIWVFRSAHPEIDENKVTKALKSMGLAKFYKNVNATLENWFGGKPATEVTDYITDYIFQSGVFGLGKNSIIFREAIKGKKTGSAASRLGYILKNIFPPYPEMSLAYPVLKRCPFLLPFVWVMRWFKGLIFKRDNMKRQLKGLQYLNSDDIRERKKALEFVGLKLDFRE